MLLVIYRTQHKSTGSFCFPQSNYIYKVGGTSPSHRSLFITVLSNVPGLMNTTHPLCTVTGLTNSTPYRSFRTVPTPSWTIPGSHNTVPQSYMYTNGLMNSTSPVTVSHFPLSLLPSFHLGMKTNGIFPVQSRSVFYIFPSVSVFARSRFRICRSRKWCFPFVSE
jgi:hypothetical protein